MKQKNDNIINFVSNVNDLNASIFNTITRTKQKHSHQDYHASPTLFSLHNKNVTNEHT